MNANVSEVSVAPWSVIIRREIHIYSHLFFACTFFFISILQSRLANTWRSETKLKTPGTFVLLNSAVNVVIKSGSQQGCSICEREVDFTLRESSLSYFWLGTRWLYVIELKGWQRYLFCLWRTSFRAFPSNPSYGAERMRSFVRWTSTDYFAQTNLYILRDQALRSSIRIVQKELFQRYRSRWQRKSQTIVVVLTFGPAVASIGPMRSVIWANMNLRWLGSSEKSLRVGVVTFIWLLVSDTYKH